MPDQPTLADLAERQAHTAARLVACLREFPDDPTCCAELVEANQTAIEALDQALYPEESADEPRPSVSLTGEEWDRVLTGLDYFVLERAGFHMAYSEAAEWRDTAARIREQLPPEEAPRG